MEEKYIKDDRGSSDTLLEVIKLPHDKTVKQNYQETKRRWVKEHLASGIKHLNYFKSLVTTGKDCPKPAVFREIP